MSLFKNVNVVSLYVTNWEEAKAFYTRVLGWPVAWADDPLGWVEYGNENETHLAISRWDGPEPVPSRKSVTPVLTVEDAQAAALALRAMGVRVDDVEEIPGVVAFGSFYDPEGNRIQFASSPQR
jgi:catechol 2,3-dioxygenase-like lactoylglutathione lyase family enzyme